MLKKALATVRSPDARPTPGRRVASTTTPVVRASAAASSGMNHNHGNGSGTSSVMLRQLRGGINKNALAGATRANNNNTSSSSTQTPAASGRGRRVSDPGTAYGGGGGGGGGGGRRSSVVPSALFGNNKASEPAEVSVPIHELTETCRRGIKTYGYDDAETQILLDVMMYAQLRGNNQGIIKVTTKGIARDPAAGPITTEHETMLSACFNGNKNAGMVVLHKAMETAVSKAKEHGFGICGTNNTCTSTGALGYYAENVAKQGMIALVFAVSPEFVAPNGGDGPLVRRFVFRHST